MTRVHGPDTKLCLSIANVRMAVSCRAPLTIRAAGAAASFLVSCGNCRTPDISLNVTMGDLSRAADRGSLIFDAGELWQLFRDGDALLYRFTSPVTGAVPYKVARLRSDYAAGEVCLHAPYFDTSRALDPLEYPLDELILTNFLARGRGVEIHGCGVMDRAGAGYLFAGHSGSGKTTMARIWDADPETTVLSDDRVVLRPAGGRIWMHGTPWHGDGRLAAPVSAPLARVFFLEHGRSHQLARLEGASAAAHLFSCAFPPFHDAAALGLTVDLLGTIPGRIPCHTLSFAPDSSAIDFVRAKAA